MRSIENRNITIDPASLVQIILDGSNLIQDNTLADRIEVVSRKLCFYLHNLRSNMIGYDSQFPRIDGRRAIWLWAGMFEYPSMD